MSLTIDPTVLDTLPKRTRTRKPPKYASEIQEAIDAFKADPEKAVLGVPATEDKQNSVRQALYTAAKEAGVKIRTYWLGVAEKPQDVVAFKVTSLTLDSDSE